MRRVVAVTGGTGDIGIEICRALVRADLEPLAIDLDAPETGAAKLFAAGVTSAYRQADVTDRRQLEAALETVEDLVGAVANAGVVESAPFLEVTEGQWARQLAVNLTGAFNTVQAVARRLVQNGVRGRLVLVTSWVHARGQEELSAYSVSKAGMTALVAGAANELAPHGILVNAVAPGVVDAGLSRQRLEEGDVDAASVIERLPLGRFQTAPEVAEVVAFLFGPAAAYMTGGTLLADGGLSVLSPLSRR